MKNRGYVDRNVAQANQEFRRAVFNKITVPLGLTAVGAAIIGGAMFDSSSPHDKQVKAGHSISYLNKDQMETGIKVTYGDTAEHIVQTVNGNRLNGQSLIDAETYVNNQGIITETNADGKIDHDLATGQTVKAPVLSDAQIEQVNNGSDG